MKRQFNYLNMKWTQRLTNETNQWYLEISGDAIPKFILKSNQGLLYGFNPSLMKAPTYKGFSNDRFKKVKSFQKNLSKVLIPPANNSIRYERPLKFTTHGQALGMLPKFELSWHLEIFWARYSLTDIGYFP